MSPILPSLTFHPPPKILFERLALLQKIIEEVELQKTKLLDLYLSGDFPKEILVEQKTKLEEMLASLWKEHGDINSYYAEDVTITEDQFTEIEEFCAEILKK